MEASQIDLRNTDVEVSDAGLFRSIFRALGKDYINICLINVEKETAKTLKKQTNTSEKAALSELPECSYAQRCHRLICKVVAPEKQEKMFERTRLECVREIPQIRNLLMAERQKCCPFVSNNIRRQSEIP